MTPVPTFKIGSSVIVDQLADFGDRIVAGDPLNGGYSHVGPMAVARGATLWCHAVFRGAVAVAGGQSTESVRQLIVSIANALEDSERDPFRLGASAALESPTPESTESVEKFEEAFVEAWCERAGQTQFIDLPPEN
jgi:hypothetical protein